MWVILRPTGLDSYKWGNRIPTAFIEAEASSAGSDEYSEREVLGMPRLNHIIRDYLRGSESERILIEAYGGTDLLDKLCKRAADNVIQQTGELELLARRVSQGLGKERFPH